MIDHTTWDVLTSLFGLADCTMNGDAGTAALRRQRTWFVYRRVLLTLCLRYALRYSWPGAACRGTPETMIRPPPTPKTDDGHGDCRARAGIQIGLVTVAWMRPMRPKGTASYWVGTWWFQLHDNTVTERIFFSGWGIKIVCNINHRMISFKNFYFECNQSRIFWVLRNLTTIRRFQKKELHLHDFLEFSPKRHCSWLYQLEIL